MVKLNLYVNRYFQKNQNIFKLNSKLFSKYPKI